MTTIHAGSRVIRMPAHPEESPWPTLGPPLEPPYELSGDIPERIRRGAEGARLRNLHPYRSLNRYDRTRAARNVKTVVIENDRLRAEFLPELGGRLWSLRDLERDVELLHSPDEIVFANLALRNAWFAGGIEFNIGTRGHAGHTCDDVHTAVVVSADGTESLRLWGYERVHGLVFQIDVALPRAASALIVRVRVRNPNAEPRPLYWWSNAAVPQTPRTRVLAADRRAYATDYDGGIRATDIDAHHGVDCSWPARCPHASDFFFEQSAVGVPWVAAVDDRGDGLLMVSDTALPGRKLFCWGATAGSEWWQRWLTPGGGTYAEIQAGVTTTQFETTELAAGAVYEWTEVYGNPRLGEQDPSQDWDRAAAHAGAVAGEALRATLTGDVVGDAVRDLPVRTILHSGTGWGALASVLEPGISDARTPFPQSDLGESQRAWVFVARGERPPSSVRPAAGEVRGDNWEHALDAVLAEHEDSWLSAKAGVIRHARGDLEGAEAHYRRALTLGPDAEAAWGLGHLMQELGRDGSAYLRRAAQLRPSDPEAVAELAATLIAIGAPEAALSALEDFPAVADVPRVRVQRVRALIARGRPADVAAARRELEDGIELIDLREGETALPALWEQLSDAPLPARYDTKLS
ncbi:DUF5107 domain-containing protein [Agromyces mediolanus]|uniref:DUF5107 domain-containing protein n=1 Tax=Agromyces mediolanus TaxID=41986 RepID=UPI001E5AAA11|nr:DUF5107 domain-containing protein [Agromyces mediolanus]MCD1570572.1 DUF5107 domain-containing protein [Agromyces mediolanus]